MHNASSNGNTLIVDRYTAGRIGPSEPMVGPINAGDRICATTPPGCCGPQITPHFRGGHEVITPVEVKEARVGDAVVLKVEAVMVKSLASSTGVTCVKEETLGEDGLKRCPKCGTSSPGSVIKGIGPSSIRCSSCGEDVSSIGFEKGYTMVFDLPKTIGLSIDAAAAERLARDARRQAALPKNAEQNPILLFALSSMVGTMARLRPFVGHIGTCPSADIPDHMNAGDSASRLIGAKHQFGFPDEATMRQNITDAHLDSNAVVEGCVLICPVKRNGAGVYWGDVHAAQGGGELAGHTLDVSAEVTVKVEVIRGLGLEGPLLLPPVEFLPHLAQPYSAEELQAGRKLAGEYGINFEEEVGPIEVIGSGKTTNDATANAFARAEKLFELSRAELRNRCTVTGGVRIGRLGTVRLGFLAPFSILDRVGLGSYVREQYK